jgi:hypothetical protein
MDCVIATTEIIKQTERKTRRVHTMRQRERIQTPEVTGKQQQKTARLDDFFLEKSVVVVGI